MKIVGLILFVVCNLQLHAQRFSTPNSYFNFIRLEKENVSKSISNYVLNLSNISSADEVINSKKILITVIQKSKAKVVALKNGFNGDLDFQNAFVDYLNSTEKLVKNETITKSNFKNIADFNYDEMKKYLNEQKNIQVEVKNQAAKLNQIEREFAEKYKLSLKITENDLSKKMSTALAVFEHHSALYLIYFKSNIAHYNYMIAVNKKDITAIKTTSKILNEFTIEGLNEINTMLAYENDESLLKMTKEVLEYDKQETQSFTTFLLSYLDESSAFASAKKQIDSANDADKIEKFNNLVAKMNANIKEFNVKNAEIRTTQKILLNSWNITAERFLKTHIPKN